MNSICTMLISEMASMLAISKLIPILTGPSVGTNKCVIHVLIHNLYLINCSRPLRLKFGLRYRL